MRNCARGAPEVMRERLAVIAVADRPVVADGRDICKAAPDLAAGAAYGDFGTHGLSLAK